MNSICDECWYNNYDEEQDLYYCSMHFDEDEWQRLGNSRKTCPHFRPGNEYEDVDNP